MSKDSNFNKFNSYLYLLNQLGDGTPEVGGPGVMGRNGGVGNGGAFDAMMLRMARDGRLSELEQMQCFQWEVIKLYNDNIVLNKLI